MAAAGLAAGCPPLFVADSAFQLGFGIELTGLAMPPLLVLCSVLADLAVYRAVLTQALAWLNSARAAGSAGVVAVAGRAVGAFGAHGGFAVAAVAAGVNGGAGRDRAAGTASAAAASGRNAVDGVSCPRIGHWLRDEYAVQQSGRRGPGRQARSVAAQLPAGLAGPSVPGQRWAAEVLDAGTAGLSLVRASAGSRAGHR